MLIILRVLALFVAALLICIFGSIYALIRFKHPNNVMTVARWFGALHPIFGLKVILRRHEAVSERPVVYMANHQNNYDMVTISSMVMPRTVSIGKKSLAYIPFFGLVYWATGNILLDRDNRGKAIHTMTKVADTMKKRNLSIWVFPEGTRSRGRGLLPFKTGAFHTALLAGAPIVPVICSDLHQKVKLNRWNNGYVICEMLEPIDTTGYSRENLRELIALTHQKMESRLAEINAEAKALENQG